MPAGNQIAGIPFHLQIAGAYASKRWGRRSPWQVGLTGFATVNEIPATVPLQYCEKADRTHRLYLSAAVAASWRNYAG